MLLVFLQSELKFHHDNLHHKGFALTMNIDYEDETPILTRELHQKHKELYLNFVLFKLPYL